MGDSRHRGDGGRRARRDDGSGRLGIHCRARRRRGHRPRPLPQRLADAIGELLGDPDRRREMGERGKAEAMRFDVSSVLDATLGVYERALADKSA